jgi:hypothetical protein
MRSLLRIVAIILISIVLVGCASGRIYKDEKSQVFIKEYIQVSPTVVKAKVEYYYPKTDKQVERKDWETVRLDCQAWTITIYDRISFDENGKIKSMGQFNIDNEFKIQGGTFGSILFEYFCIK